MARIISDQKWLAVQRRAVPPRQAPVRAPRIGVKNIEGRIRNRTFKIKKTTRTTKRESKKKWSRCS